MGIRGAILGDIIGSCYEYHCAEPYKVKLLDKKHFFTDDTVMTIAVKDAIVHHKPYERCFIDWFYRYPDRGYGQRFYRWCLDGIPYRSIGNGSAMRVSYVIDCSDTVEDAEKLAIDTCISTHNTEEAIRGAVTCAVLGVMAKNGQNKAQLYDYATKQYPILMGKTYKDFAQKWNAHCETTMPLALSCFFESDNFEDCMRKVLEMEVDCDTLCCICGAIAEEYYHMDKDNLFELISPYLPQDMIDVIND